MPTYTSPFTGNVVQPTDVSYVSYTISDDLILEWPSNVNPVTNVAARIMEIEATTGGLLVIMPPANQVSVGQDALIRNIGSTSFDVVDNSSGAIITVLGGNAEYIYVTDNSTVDGVWGIIAFGAGTSGSDSATLAGYGLLAISNTLNQSHPSTSVSDNYTFATTDRAKTEVWLGGVGSATLPSVATLGDNWFMLFKNNGTGTFTFNCTGSDKLDLQSFKNFQPDESAFIICTGSSYVTVGFGVSNTFFFTALTKAIATGTYTLTNNESKSVIQEYVGTLSGDVEVIYPPTVAFYIVSNQTTAGSYTLTITTNIGGGAVAVIPSGQQASLICDGVNFYNANTVQAGASVNSLTNGTATNPSLNFASETNTGIYRPGSGEIGFTVLGTQVGVLSATGLSITGTITATKYVGISGGDF